MDEKTAVSPATIETTFNSQKLSELLSMRFCPAETECNADVFLTTEEVIDRLKEHTGIAIDKQQMYSMLKELGYKEACDEDLKYYWLFAEK